MIPSLWCIQPSHIASSTIAACDGIVFAGPECFEPEGIAALREWFAESSRPVYACGPLIPHGTQAAAFEKAQSPEAAKIESFLNAKLASHGDHSVIYVGFVPCSLAGYSLTELYSIGLFWDDILPHGASQTGRVPRNCDGEEYSIRESWFFAQYVVLTEVRLDSQSLITIHPSSRRSH